MGSTRAPEPQWALVEVSETDIARYDLVDDHDEADARTNLPSRTTAGAMKTLLVASTPRSRTSRSHPLTIAEVS